MKPTPHDKRPAEPWQCRRRALADDRGEQLQFFRANTPLSRSGFFRSLAEDEYFCQVFSTALADCGFAAAYWECPGWDPIKQDSPFECVLLDAPTLLNKKPDSHSFSDFIDDSDRVSTFDNLGASAGLISPCTDGGRDFSHLLAFVRNAQATQCNALWRELARTWPSQQRAGRRWLSTSGGGVAWLHLRLDSAPKYYQFTPYRQASISA